MPCRWTRSTGQRSQCLGDGFAAGGVRRRPRALVERSRRPAGVDHERPGSPASPRAPPRSSGGRARSAPRRAAPAPARHRPPCRGRPAPAGSRRSAPSASERLGDAERAPAPAARVGANAARPGCAHEALVERRPRVRRAGEPVAGRRAEPLAVGAEHPQHPRLGRVSRRAPGACAPAPPASAATATPGPAPGRNSCGGDAARAVRVVVAGELDQRGAASPGRVRRRQARCTASATAS